MSGPSRRWPSDDAKVAVVHEADKACGAPRITVELNDGAGERERVNHKRVARVMREHSIDGIRLRRRVCTTIADPDGQVVPDLLERDFTATEQNTKYVGDITYLPCGNGQLLYLGAVGTSADNAMAESFNATLKRETLAGANGWTDAAGA